MKKQYLQPQATLKTFSSCDIITLSENLFGQIFRFGKISNLEIAEDE